MKNKSQPTPANLKTSDRIATVTVTHHPDLEVLTIQLLALPNDACKIIVDNASLEPTVQGLNKLITRIPNSFLLLNHENVGLATALNQGARSIKRFAPDAKLLLLLDQDSQPEPRSIEALIAVHNSLLSCGERVGAVGPQLRDADTELMHGFHQMTRLRWRRAFPSTNQTQPLAVANLNGSGTLMRTKVFEQMEGLDDSLFIDHLDTEWSFRLLDAGYSLWGVPQAVFTHRMGMRGVRFWLFGPRVWPARSAFRHRYLFRNTILLMRRPYVPRVWKAWATIKLLLTTTLHGLFDPERKSQLEAMWQGAVEGLCPEKSVL